jgi:hypothetical protein
MPRWACLQARPAEFFTPAGHRETPDLKPITSGLLFETAPAAGNNRYVFQLGPAGGEMIAAISAIKATMLSSVLPAAGRDYRNAGRGDVRMQFSCGERVPNSFRGSLVTQTTSPVRPQERTLNPPIPFSFVSVSIIRFALPLPSPRRLHWPASTWRTAGEGRIRQMARIHELVRRCRHV